MQIDLTLIFISLWYSAKLVDAALASGKLYEGEGFKYIKESFETGTLHLIGLLSDGGVHSRLDQVQVCVSGGMFALDPVMGDSEYVH